MMFRNLVLVSTFFTCFTAFAQNLPKHEFRGVWVAIVANIDWPTSQGLTSEEQQQAFKDLVAFHKANGMNALIVQLRPNADALYESQYEPWSRWLRPPASMPNLQAYALSHSGCFLLKNMMRALEDIL